MFRVRRDKVRAYPGGKPEYLAAMADQAVEPKRLCHAIARANDGLGKEYANSGVPWLTMVLGSGCLDAEESDGDRSLSHLPDRVERAVGSTTFLRKDGRRTGRYLDAVVEFTQSLIDDRYQNMSGLTKPSGSVEGTAAAPDSAADLHPWDGELVLLCTVLTRFYYDLRARSNQAMSRHAWSTASFDTAEWDAAESGDETPVGLIDSIRDLLDSLSRYDASVVGRELDAMVKELSQAFGERRIELTSEQVGLLTELCWHSLTSGTTVYPGWSDLLIDLSMQVNSTPREQGRTRPSLYAVSSAVAPLIKRYNDVTARSWATRHADPSSSPRDDFYTAVASVLTKQSQLRQQMKRVNRPTPATCFVTTFDLELEMALLTHPDAGPFLVACPVNLIATPADRKVDKAVGATCWLGCVVTPGDEPTEDQIQLLRQPQNWFLLSKQVRAYAHLPLVVRLSGSPLMKLPDLPRKPAEPPDNDFRSLERGTLLAELLSLPGLGDFANLYNGGWRLRLEPAIMLDEYSAIRQSALEFQADHTGLGLPSEIVRSEAHPPAPQFWMMMGVQVGDTGVRHRLTTQIAVPQLVGNQPAVRPSRKSPDELETNRPGFSGVAINRRLDGQALDLLFWAGCDVVQARSEDFTDELEHYARHLDEYLEVVKSDPAGVIDKTSYDESCPLP